MPENETEQKVLTLSPSYYVNVSVTLLPGETEEEALKRAERFIDETYAGGENETISFSLAEYLGTGFEEEEYDEE